MRPSSRSSRGRGRSGGPPNDGRGRGGRRTGSNPISEHHSHRMELIASVSRSSGLEKDGDLLKEHNVQEEFRSFVEKKLRTFWDLYGTGSPTKSQIESVQRKKKDNQDNILILFRKLREGLFASGRKDGFALEVYETSLCLSVIFDSPVQTTSISSRLVPDFYLATPAPPHFRRSIIIILLLHQLVTSFPSQQAYLSQIKYLVPNLLERPSATYSWISTLARSLRTLNFVQFESLSHPDAFEHLLSSSPPNSSPDVMATKGFDGLPRIALRALVSRLRLKAGDAAWMIVRNAYRELSSSDETQSWLGKRLFFDSFGSETTVVRFHDWVRERCRDGHLRSKEGVEERWMVCKPVSTCCGKAVN